VEIVRQKDVWSCYACVAATITGETLEDVISFVGHDGSAKVEWSKHPDKYRGFTMDEINLYLASRHYTLGVVGANVSGMKADIVDKYERIDVQVPFSLRALILVESSLFDGITHCLYWDGKHAFDPNHVGPVELKNYELLEWWPVIKFENHGVSDHFAE
jgi:hypothetical protein